MINAIIEGILSLLVLIIDTTLSPINALVESLFPDMTEAIQIFNNFVSTYLGSTLSYFFSILPPTFVSLLTLWFTFLVAYYSIYYVYNFIVKVFELIQKIKFW